MARLALPAFVPALTMLLLTASAARLPAQDAAPAGAAAPAAHAHAADAPGAVPAAAIPVTDPVFVGWEKQCVVHRYSPAEGKWSSFPGPRAVMPEFAVAAVGPHHAAALVAARRHAGWLFDLHAQQWTAIPPSPLEPPRGTMGARAVRFVGDKLVVWGMTNGPQGAVLDVKTMTWRPTAAAPVVGRYRCVTGVIGGRLLVWGGYGPLNPQMSGPLADGAVYDVAADAWEKMPDPPVPGHRYGCAFGVWNDRFVIFGGSTREGFVRTGMMYDPAARAWEKMADTPFDVGINTAAAIDGDRLFVWSGGPTDGRGGGSTPEGALYDFKTRQWEKLPHAPIEPRQLAFARAHDGRVTVWGGWDPGARPGAGSYADGAVYDLWTRRWEPIPVAPARVPHVLHPGW